MKPADAQLELPLHEVALVDVEVVQRQPSLTRAIVVCGDLAGFEDKEAADAAGVDPATWSRIKNGQVNFPQARLTLYQRRCKNWLPLQWQARDAGFGLIRLESVLERQLRETQEELARERGMRQNAERLLMGRGGQ